MTREEAIQEFQNVKDLIRQDGKDWFDERDLELIDMAIEALHREEAEEKGYCHRIRPSNVEVVVRCKDCRWFKQDSSPVGYGYCDGRMVGREVDYNDYCSYGERQCNYFGERREE